MQNILQVVYAVKYIDSKSPIAAASNTELSTEEGVATVGDGGIATLDKTVCLQYSRRLL